MELGRDGQKMREGIRDGELVMHDIHVWECQIPKLVNVNARKE